jgi:hypothetical protein
MKTSVNLLPDTEVSSEVADSEAHNVRVRVDGGNQDVYLECSSREALYEFGKALMCEALYGSGQGEFYSLGQEGKWLVVNGARLTADSSRLFVFTPQGGSEL